ncbi:MAG: hypothetical protein P4K93_14960 [Terracidiphilus sp.]|nr:hypothetical protein [Terracidiphilus sp.]MDR3799457.1 hypothetical protein [Terracidiphilus sp.]
MRAISRIFLSFCSLLLAVALFCCWLGSAGSWSFIFKITMIFALPVWLINLPVLFLLKNVGRHSKWIVPALGGLIGPVCVILWCGILVLRGGDWASIWNGDPEAGGLESALIFASLIGLATNSFYTVALILSQRLTAPHAPHSNEQGAEPPTR